MTVDALSLRAVGEKQLAEARSGPAGRAARTVYGGRERTLRQTVLALAGGNRLDDHENPGQATLLVLSGEVQLGTSTGAVTGTEGDFLIIPDERHNLAALTDAVVLLTVVART